MLRRILFFVCLFVALYTNAKEPAGLKNGKPYVKVLRATVQRTMPGRNTGVISNYDFIVVWTSKMPPASFFWRGQDGWLTCNVLKVHGAGKKNSLDYVPDKNGMDARINKGDTLEITPVPGGRFAIPSQIPGGAVNTLFFKTDQSGWLYYKTKLTQKPDVILP
ncbi:MAG: hypothetical protein P4L41_10535 [Flavipsychrobacter sp.]|nr:hypothetical protein [Flavipsychrobacter sp.]